MTTPTRPPIDWTRVLRSLAGAVGVGAGIALVCLPILLVYRSCTAAPGDPDVAAKRCFGALYPGQDVRLYCRFYSWQASDREELRHYAVVCEAHLGEQTLFIGCDGNEPHSGCRRILP